MPAKPYLAARRKPPQFIMRSPVAGLGHEKGGLRKIIFCSDFTQNLVI
jgi:hypothetical protein